MSTKLLRFSLLLVFIFVTACSGGGTGGGTGGTSGGGSSGGGSSGGGTGGGGGGGSVSYTVSVGTTGLTSTGLEVSLSSTSGSETMSISSDGTQSFSLQLPSGAAYSVGVSAQPAGQSCSIGGAYSSTGINADATATVTCVDTNTVSGNVSGLSGSLILRLNNSESLTLSSNSSFAFTTAIGVGSYYTVSVDTQPAGQLCTVSNSGGQMVSGGVSNVAVSCTTAAASGYHVGGFISGMSGYIVLDLNGSEELAQIYNGSFTFDTLLQTNDSYSVSVASAGSSNVCSVNNGSGTINGSDYPFVDVSCTQTASTTIQPSVDVSSLWLSSGETITVNLNGVEDMVLNMFSFVKAFNTALNPGDSYNISLVTPPAGKDCVLSDSVGVIEAGVTPIATVQCVTSGGASYNIGGAVTGLSNSGLVLNLDGRDSLSIGASATAYTFTNPQLDSTSHTVTIESQPTGQICSVNNGYPYVFGADVTNVDIICSNGPHSIGGNVTGLNGSGLVLSLNGGESLPVAASGSFAFSTLFSDGMDYNVSIESQPAGQICSTSYASGWGITSSVSNILVDCADKDYAVSVNVAGYSSTTPLSLILNGDEIIDISSNTNTFSSLNPVSFSTRLTNGASYSVALAAQPAGQVCTLSNASGTISAADVEDIGVYCYADTGTPGAYTVGVTTTGLLGSGLTLQLNGGSDLAVSSDGYSTFASSLADSAAYTVSVAGQTAGPLQLCQVYNATGTVSGSNVTHVYVRCGNAVESLYPSNGSKWLYFVKNDGATTTTATDTACDASVDTGGYNSCLNGGEYMVVSAPYLANCTGVTATDSLGAFNWICDDTAGVKIISNGLANGASLSQLIDFTNGKFKDNYVSIDNGGSVEVTQPAVWWSNPVYANNDSSYINEGDIALITGTVASSIDMPSHTAVLVESGQSTAGAITASNTDYLWFEGDIDGSLASGLSWSTTRFSLIQNVQSQNNSSNGVYAKGDNLVLHNLTTNSNGGVGTYVSGYYLDINTITATGNFGSSGIQIGAGSSTLDTLVSSDNTNGYGVYLNAYTDVTMNNVTANNNGVSSTGKDGIDIIGDWSSPTPNHAITNLVANGNQNDGIFVQGITQSSLSNLSVENNGRFGFHVDTSDTSDVNNLYAVGNTSNGARLFRWNYSKAENFSVDNNGGYGVSFEQCDKGYAAHMMASNNTSHGYVLDSTDHFTSVDITATNNGGSGIAYLGSSTSNYRNLMLDATSANNASSGFEITRMDDIQFASLLALNNGVDGFYTYTFVNRITAYNVLTANNTNYGFNIGSSDDKFSGLASVGTNGQGNCNVDSFFAVNPGFAVKANKSCVISNASDATVISGIDGSTSVVGKVASDDTSTADDDATPGISLYDNITGWSTFDNVYRSWGVDGALAFADASNQGTCGSGINCRIWDWSMSTTDAGDGGSAAAYNVIAMPTATDFVTMNWITIGAADQAYCDANYPGSVWDGATGCANTYLPSAQEISGDSIGNDNYLCEAGETCLYTPNIGSYQGHGSTSQVGTIGTGADTITLMEYSTLGR